MNREGIWKGCWYKLEINNLVNQNIFTKQILMFLRNNSGRSFTTKELADMQHCHDSLSPITKSVELLVKQGLAKVKSRGGELCYQVILAQ